MADSNKRRTLSRADIAKALSKSDQFDFLIDIVPREEPVTVGVPGVPGAVRQGKKGVGSQVKAEQVSILSWSVHSVYTEELCIAEASLA